jgi:hypothetical protein
MNPALHIQSAAEKLPRADCDFAGHGTHVSACAAPTAADHVFSAHAVHVAVLVAPTAALHVPAPQPAHVAALVAPAAALHVPAAHSTHAALPRAALKLPARHSWHDPPSAPEAPASHEQFSRDPDASGEFEFAGHGWQSGLPLSDHVPAGHRRQDSTSTAPAAEYSPAPHREHS